MKDAIKDKELNLTPRDHDHWERKLNKWIRHHNMLRSSLFMPDIMDGGPRPESLQPYRLTRIVPSEKEEGDDDFIDGWNVVDFTDSSSFVTDLGYQWKGYTVFIEKEDFKTDTKGKLIQRRFRLRTFLFSP